MANCIYPEEAAHEDDEIYKICVYSEDGHEFDQLEKALHSQYILTRVIEDPIKNSMGQKLQIRI